MAFGVVGGPGVVVVFEFGRVAVVVAVSWAGGLGLFSACLLVLAFLVSWLGCSLRRFCWVSLSSLLLALLFCLGVAFLGWFWFFCCLWGVALRAVIGVGELCAWVPVVWLGQLVGRAVALLVPALWGGFGVVLGVGFFVFFPLFGCLFYRLSFVFVGVLLNSGVLLGFLVWRLFSWASCWGLSGSSLLLWSVGGLASWWYWSRSCAGFRVFSWWRAALLGWVSRSGVVVVPLVR
ncbi:hypothetical protein [Thioalkalivibrio sp. ALJ24]|uniref:hypothetical protein n=1 Tax=Thioalkalivibrio sp. ALJ24 TaxID=545276 RepID=UPI0012EA5ADF|nr:hypothetical protein [Thioalkalivibrio sp. ALJ24]